MVCLVSTDVTFCEQSCTRLPGLLLGINMRFEVNLLLSISNLTGYCKPNIATTINFVLYRQNRRCMLARARQELIGIVNVLS